MPEHPVLDYLRRITASDCVREAPDADLLARFVARRDEAAFAGLVQRHGPMVLGVCLRVLGDTPDAEDAFQAAFLVLARRAPSVAKPELLGNWLYGVAYRTALKAHTDLVRRQTREGPEPSVDRGGPAEEAARSELRRVLDHELSRLPDRYRMPLVLHYLEGHTQEEVAQRLACPRKTVTTRLARACAHLHAPLARRGLALSAGGLAAALSQEASAALPTTLLHATVEAATLFAADEATAAGAISAKVFVLTKGVLRAMLMTSLKTAALTLLALTLLGIGAGLGVYKLFAVEQPEARKEAPPTPALQAAQASRDSDKEKLSDLERLQGVWTLIAMESAGKKASPDEVNKNAAKLNCAGDKVVIEQGAGSETARVRIDAAKQPKQIDLIVGRNDVHKGIYRLDGDTLTICKYHPPEERPSEFTTKAGARWPMLLVFKKSGQSDHAKLQGAWTVTESEVGGKAAKRGNKFVFSGDKLVVHLPEGKKDEIAFKLDPFASPKAADLTALTGKQEGNTLLAIYALDGDTLKLCLSWEERRPTEFSAPGGRKMQVIVLKRAE
jgi:RNA polymerase sigma factor (sigma-70 family)